VNEVRETDYVLPKRNSSCTPETELEKNDNMEIGHLDIGEWGVLGVIKNS
jgi:hypothetical protein